MFGKWRPNIFNKVHIILTFVKRHLKKKKYSWISVRYFLHRLQSAELQKDLSWPIDYVIKRQRPSSEFNKSGFKLIKRGVFCFFHISSRHEKLPRDTAKCGCKKFAKFQGRTGKVLERLLYGELLYRQSTSVSGDSCHNKNIWRQ